MAGLSFNPLALFAAKAAQGIQAPAAAPPDRLAPYKNDISGIEGDLSRPKNVQSAPTFGGQRSQLGSFDMSA